MEWEGDRLNTDVKQDAIDRWKAASAKKEEPAWLLKAEEAARLLGLSRSRVYELIASNELPSIMIGRSRRLRRDQLLKWLDERAA